MSVYIPTEWKNGQEPAINAVNLNHMEGGIRSAHEDITSTADDVALKLDADDYATQSRGGTIKVRLSGEDLYITTDGSTP